MQGIYFITNNINHRVYYGSSFNIQKRLKGHTKALENGNHHNIFLQRDYNKLGCDYFLFGILEKTSFVDREDLLKYEQTFIDINETGYNLAPAFGGDINSKHPCRDIIIEKMRKSVRARMDSLSPQERKDIFGNPGEKNGMYGRKHSQESKEKMSVALKGHSNNLGSRWSEDSKRNRSECLKGTRMGKDNPFFGRHHSEETKEKLRNNTILYHGMRDINPAKLSYTKKYIIEDLKTGDREEFYGLKVISKRYNCSAEAVHAFIKRGGIAQNSRCRFVDVHIYKEID